MEIQGLDLSRYLRIQDIRYEEEESCVTSSKESVRDHASSTGQHHPQGGENGSGGRGAKKYFFMYKAQ